MRKLLRANFSRLGHDGLFRLLTGLMVFVGVLIAVINAVHIRLDGSVWEMDFSLLTCAMLAPILNSVFTAMFIGSDYSGGTMRNKLIAGHRRGSIYIANLITCCFSGMIFCIAFAIPQGVLGYILGGRFQYSSAKLVVYGCLSLALTAAFTAIFILIAMLCQNKSHTVAGCILLSFMLIFLGVYITSALNEPEYYSGYSYSENGVTVEEPEMKNPNYISGVKRQVYEFMQDFTPGGQVLQVSGLNADTPSMLAVYDGIIFFAATGFGMVFFRRKDLK